MADTYTTRGYIFSLLSSFYGQETTPGTKVTTSTFIPTIGRPTLNLDQPLHPDESMRQYLGRKDETEVMGVKSESTFQFQKELQGWSYSPGGSPPAIGDVHPDAQILIDALGGVTAPEASTTTDSGSTTSIIEVLDSTGFVAGGIVHIGEHTAMVLQVDAAGYADSLTISPPMETAPSSGVAVTSGITIHTIRQYWGTYAKSTSWEFRGQAANDCRQAMGCRPSALTISGEAKGFLKADVTYNVIDWDYLDSGGAPGAQTYAYPKIQITSMEAVMYAYSTRYRLPLRSFSLDLGLEVAPITDPNRAECVYDWQIVKMEPVLTMSGLRFSGGETSVTGLNAIYRDKGDVVILLKIGTAIGSTITICIPVGRIVEEITYSEQDSMVAFEAKIAANVHSLHSTLSGATYDDDDSADKALLIGMT